jgi:hypothetical protein
MVMIKKPKLIKFNEKSLGVLSSIQIDFPDDYIFKFLNGRSFEVVWSKGLVDINTGSGKIIIEKIIFKLTIFLKQLIKQFNNDKTINK